MKLQRHYLVLLAVLATAVQANEPQDTAATISDTQASTAQISDEASSQLAKIAELTKPESDHPIKPLDATIEALKLLTSLQAELQADRAQLQQQLEEAKSSSAKKDIIQRLDKLSDDLRTTSKNIQEVAAGADISTLRSTQQPAFNFQKELFSLLEPAMKEMKDMTSHVRQKTAQRDRIDYYSDKLPTTESAISNLEALLKKSEDPSLQSHLQSMLDAWNKQRTFLKSEIQSATLQLEKLERSEVSITESSQSYLKAFFQKRGLYLGRALLVVLIIILVSRFLYRLMERYIAGYQKAQRSFEIRLLDLTHRVITGLLLILGPMIVFYMSEDWLLFSLGIILLLVIGLTLRHALPRYWQIIQLFLNVGTVREGERVELNGLPWLVRKINFYTLLQNPTAGLTTRVKIDDLLEMRSRETKEREVWFPCRPGDWLLFENNRLGKVVSISEELTEIVLRGGAHKTYTTQGFLSAEPVCLSQNFRVRETIGVSYSLQVESVTTLCGELHEHVIQRIADEGYDEHLINLAVEFQYANTSSLDIAVTADFDGELAQLYNRLRRRMQRWCVEACNQHDWEIPFTQVTVHRAD